MPGGSDVGEEEEEGNINVDANVVVPYAIDRCSKRFEHPDLTTSDTIDSSIESRASISILSTLSEGMTKESRICVSR